MSSHTHSFDAWPFIDPIETVSFICDHVLVTGLPILRVCHDVDGDWQFLCGGDHSNSSAAVVCLGCALDRDGSLRELGKLPLGWAAVRELVGAEWTLEQLPANEEEYDA